MTPFVARSCAQDDTLYGEGITRRVVYNVPKAISHPASTMKIGWGTLVLIL